ncbi:hypothetical protein C7Y72_04255 [Paraconexibacter algicola]|uniref:TVP38/TMEM64 family membrane protein n=1 Tax=Paraconexibacter algicola TaxID=2133960 RepID=A0A2T4UI67_9ACTN|nr:hypothetical protein C7Y72_04255 [Paraconexibacter algicola]
MRPRSRASPSAPHARAETSEKSWPMSCEARLPESGSTALDSPAIAGATRHHGRRARVFEPLAPTPVPPPLIPRARRSAEPDDGAVTAGATRGGEAGVREDLEALVSSAGAAGPVAFVVLYVLLTVALVPGTIPSLAAGVLFGPVWGSLLTVLGATLGAVAAFEIARRLGRERTRRLLGRRGATADAWLSARGLRGVVALRLIPVLPFNALNYAFGLSGVTRRAHALGTLVGIVPGTVAFVALGDSLADPGSTGFVLSLGAVVLLLLLGATQQRRRVA